MCDKCECVPADTAPTWAEWHAAAVELVEARKKEAQAFVRFKAQKDRTDGQAARMAYLETNGEADMAEAKITYLRGMLGCR